MHGAVNDHFRRAGRRLPARSVMLTVSPQRFKRTAGRSAGAPAAPLGVTGRDVWQSVATAHGQLPTAQTRRIPLIASADVFTFKWRWRDEPPCTADFEEVLGREVLGCASPWQ
jgi:hypothetical protein